MAHSITISVDLDRWTSKSTLAMRQVNQLMAGRLEKLFSHALFDDINVSYATPLAYPYLDKLAVKVLWLHGVVLVLLLMLDAYVRLPDIFPSPMGWRSITISEAVIVLAIGAVAMTLPLLAQTRVVNHFLWRILLALSLAVFSYLFIYISGGAVAMHFHLFLVMAFVAIYVDWRLEWWLLGFISVINLTLDSLVPNWLYSYGHNELSVPLQTIFLLIMAYFTTVLCQNHRASIMALVEAKLRNDQFLAIASHELRTPLTSMKGYTEVLERRLKRLAQPELVVYTDKLDNQLNKLSGLIRDLLDVAKIQSGQMTMHRGRISINGVITQSIEEVQALSHHHKILVTGWSNTAVMGDPVRLCQVMVNLLANAIKYSPTSDKVLVRVSEGRDKVIVSVEDFGIGISAKEQVHIFEPYFRIQTTQRQDVPGGLGMGLYIASEIISWHNGKIWLESVENSGSTFSFSLPLIKTRLQHTTLTGREEEYA